MQSASSSVSEAREEEPSRTATSISTSVVSSSSSSRRSLSYQQVSFTDDGDHDDDYDNDDEDDNNTLQDLAGARRTMWNFTLMSILFSANHGCVVSCLGLASARLGSTGAWQSGILYIFYTSSALLGATYIVKQTGSRNALFLGMLMYCFYVACFWVATLFPNDKEHEAQRVSAAYIGAAIGGIGAGFLWTAQGAYFAQSAEDHARRLRGPVSASTASLAGVFAFFYLGEEVALRLLSSFLLEFRIASWSAIFGIYTAVTVLSTLAIPCVHNYPKTTMNDVVERNEDEHDRTEQTTTISAIFYKVSAALQLLVNDRKMKWMIGLNAVFGFTASFLNSYVNGQVVPVALDDPDSKYIGVLSSWVSTVAAAMSLVFGRLAPRTGKGPILILGAVCFFLVVFPFVVQPDATQYGWTALIFIYTMHGFGRSTFEGTLKATFADYFSYEKEGAFANIILQNGLSGAIGYILTFSLLCDTPSRYCIEYKNGTLHDVLTFELIAIASAITAVFGYLRASVIFQQEREEEHVSDGGEPNNDTTMLLEQNDAGVSA